MTPWPYHWRKYVILYPTHTTIGSTDTCKDWNVVRLQCRCPLCSTGSFVVVVKPRWWGWIAGHKWLHSSNYLEETDARWQLSPGLEWGCWIVMRPIHNADSSRVSYNSRPYGLAALGITVSHGRGVMLHQWAVLSAQRLSGPVDCDKATESGSDLVLGVNRVLAAHFTHSPALAERALWFIKDRVVCHRHLLSDGYTKAWILGLITGFTADLEDLNATQSTMLGQNRPLRSEKHP